MTTTLASHFEPMIIQGGMGVGVSNWTLAKAVSSLGQLGVVSGSCLDSLMIRRLQSGDPGGHIRRAMEQFPVPEMVEQILKKYFSPEGLEANKPFARASMIKQTLSKELRELTVVSNFVEVFLAKEGHKGKVGINYLEKLQMVNLSSIYGAMLAKVDYVLMGAGIPREIPKVLDLFSQHKMAKLSLPVLGGSVSDAFHVKFSPKDIIEKVKEKLNRPKFLAIVSSVALAKSLLKKSSGCIDGFIVEGATAGGHNAPPRGKYPINERGEPVYGQKDEVLLSGFRELGKPFWLAGSYGSPEALEQAIQEGASGIQVGTPFALCQESGLTDDLRNTLLDRASSRQVDVVTDAKASPTGFPFKVARISKTNSEPDEYQKRPRICDLGYLRQPYKKENGTLGYRCAAEPVSDYVAKGGTVEETKGRKCLCNALMTNVGYPQQQKSGYIEKPLITIGNDVNNISRFFKSGNLSFSASDVIQTLLSKVNAKK